MVADPDYCRGSNLILGRFSKVLVRGLPFVIVQAARIESCSLTEKNIKLLYGLRKIPSIILFIFI
jgi:hypothetical protein